MSTRNTLRAIALAASCLTPLVAFGQTNAPPRTTPVAPAAAAPGTTAGTTIGGVPFTGMIQFNLLGIGGTNPDQFGRYSGLNTSGLDVIGKFRLNGGDTWDSGGTRYYRIEGNNLVFQTGNRLGSGVGNGGNGWSSSVNNALANNGSIDVRVGDQGIWGVEGYFDSITYTGNVIDSLYSVPGSYAFLNPGVLAYGGNLSQAALTPGAIRSSGAPIYTVPSLTATGAFQAVQTGTRRNILGGNFHYSWGDWTFTGAFRHEHKEGSLEESYYGWTGGIAFALPIDYDTDRYDVSAAYTTRMNQAVVQYSYSHFSDNNLYVTLPWPVANTGQPYQTATAYSLPPSNSAHYVTLMLASNAVPRTRLNLNARVGLEKQDDSFAPNTASPNLTAGQLTAFGLGRNLLGTTTNSPDITATVYQLKLSASSNPIDRTDVNVYYGFDGRSVSINQFEVITGGHAPDTIGSKTSSFVVPQDWFKQYFGVDAGYRLIPEYRTRLQASYRSDIVARSNAQVGHSWTNTGSVGVLSDIGPNVFGSASFEYSSRSGTLSYLTPWVALDGLADASPTYSGAYYQAPMTSEGVVLRADATPMKNLSTSLFVRFRNEDYDYPAAFSYTNPETGKVTAIAPLSGVGGGVKQDYALQIGPDVNYRVRPDINLHFFYTFERLFFNNIGNGACSTSNTGACLGSAGYFQNKSTSDTHTIGVSGKWKVNEKLALKADYTLSYGSVMFSQFNGVFVANPTQSYQNVSNYPDYNSVMNSIRLTADYKVMPNIDLVGLAAFSSLYNTNWYDRAAPAQGAGTTAISILTPGYGSPHYNVLALMGGVRFRF